jgi:hypothetical protein
VKFKNFSDVLEFHFVFVEYVRARDVLELTAVFRFYRYHGYDVVRNFGGICQTTLRY